MIKLIIANHTNMQPILLESQTVGDTAEQSDIQLSNKTHYAADVIMQQVSVMSMQQVSVIILMWRELAEAHQAQPGTFVSFMLLN